MKNVILLVAILSLSGCGLLRDWRDSFTDQLDLGTWAQEDPVLTNYVVNDNSDDLLRCLEIATGAELTEEEQEAELPEEFNSECPELANPKYQETE